MLPSPRAATPTTSPPLRRAAKEAPVVALRPRWQLAAAPPLPDETIVSVNGVEYPQITEAECATTDGWYYADAPTNPSRETRPGAGGASRLPSSAALSSR